MDSVFSHLSAHIYDYIDLIWLPITFFVVHKHQRLLSVAFVAVCLMTFRVQVELMESTGYATGFLPFMDSSVYARGVIAYSVIIMLFLILAHFSARTKKMIFFAACLSIYIFAFCVSMILMTL